MMEDYEFKEYARQIVEQAQKQGVTLRLLGAVAFSMHCPTYANFQEKAGRHFTDLDFAGYFRESHNTRNILEAMGFTEDREVAVVYARSRLIYNHPENGLHIDVFLDKLDFCHPIPWNGVLKLDGPTIPLAELLMEKMQIVEINEKDIIDTVMLLREHPIGENDTEIINSKRIIAMCVNDWGFWRTITMNLNKVIKISKGYSWLTEEDRAVITSRIGDLLSLIDAAPKTLKWTLRSAIGDKVKWYNEVGEVFQ
jgi:hypothetical protein